VEPEGRRDQTIRDLKAANDELLAERRQLMDTVESLKAGHRQLEETLDQVNELEHKLGERED
jgi:predicted nuclease with TOPRIM domain